MNERLMDPYISRIGYELLLNWGMRPEWAKLFNAIALLLITTVLVYAVQYVVRWIFRYILINVIRTTRNVFATHLLKNRFAHFLALSAPLWLIKFAIPVIFFDYPKWIAPLETTTNVYMVVMFIWLAMSVISAGFNQLRNTPGFREKPIDSYLQVIRIILYIIGAIIVYSIITGKSPLAFFTAMGAISAVLLLMFKDTIMGFVASIQVSGNDMVRIGDWITMPKYGADGDVIQITLTTVKVQNFDKTITTIPTYSLISDSFQNWRGMREAGGRRIKRSIYIRPSSIRYIKPSELDYFRQIQSLTHYIEHRQKDIDKSNQRNNVDKSLLVNGRNLTNAGLFRKYIEVYLQQHSGTHKKMTMMVRQLAPNEYGLPLEIYAFTSTTVWTAYEHIQADIFDHLLAAASYFDLEVYEFGSAPDREFDPTKLIITSDKKPPFTA
jgi:miniconductance mechanosensitive channel